MESFYAQNYVVLLTLELSASGKTLGITLRIKGKIYPVVIEIVNVLMSGSAKLYLMRTKVNSN